MAKAKSSSSNPAESSSGALISAEERRRMIAEAAYFRAQARGFVGGDPLDDWLAAEREINRALPGPQQQKEEMAAYEKLRQTLGKILAEARGTVNAETLKQAFEKATADLRKTGEYTVETINKVAGSLRKDMTSAAMNMGPKWEAFSEKTADLFSVWRDRGSQFLARAADAMADWLQQTGDKLERQRYRTGDMVHSGTFECTSCGERVVLRTPAHLPPCPKCRKLEFRRV
jgi:hypothetical protein